VLAFGLQWMFYSQPGEDGVLVWWQAILFASIVPVGLAIMAWHHQWQEQEIVTDWQALIAEVQQRAEEKQQEAAAEHERAEAMQREAEAERQRADEMQGQLIGVQTQADAVQTQFEQVQAEASRMQTKLDEMQAVDKAWQALNPEMQTLALFNARLLTAKDAAEQMGVHITTVRRRARQLNGVDGGS
jgi:capsule polysaccharide export protein KpsE/RkpR